MPEEVAYLFLSIDGPSDAVHDTAPCLERFKDMTNNHAIKCELWRYEEYENSFEAPYFVDSELVSDLSLPTEQIRQTFPKSSGTFFDKSKLPSV